MAGRYGVAGRTATTAAASDNVAGAIWNPSSNIALRIREILWFQTVATSSTLKLCRLTARGTASTTVTPDLDNAFDRLAGPASGALLDVAYSAQPTIAAAVLGRWVVPAALASVQIVFPEEPLIVPAGTGLGFATPSTAAIQAADLTVEWDE